jgi:hypothetical protein
VTFIAWAAQGRIHQAKTKTDNVRIYSEHCHYHVLTKKDYLDCTIANFYVTSINSSQFSATVSLIITSLYPNRLLNFTVGTSPCSKRM